MKYETVRYEKDKNLAVITITLNRPEHMNAISIEMLDELNLLTDCMANDSDIAAVIITGGDKCFAAGADISQVSRLDSPVDAHAFVSRAQMVMEKIERIEKPVIAAVNGVAFGGGCELALACDIRLASEDALFALPEIKIGVIPGAGGTQRLPRLIGMGRAKEMLFSGDPINAQEAYRIGLVNRIFPAGSLMDEAVKLAEKFAGRPRLALKANKTAVSTGMDMDLQSALAYEARCFELLFSTEDLKEGVQAFMEKRKPVFKGR
ncbi:enoyl-CoA hydratase [Desulfocicer vacuolatum DSM 3385]|uniref:Enoyl-CoA hydratase n=1 Tax=Desulfocicer vacuolatum DSM 3385 TaxID=1121400 RepID=A0A1W2CWK4_9BACT|nr:enoyl-CoA hydratase-related protein [Desulfocicer vacuolatum]SMC89619.1 enoyl-CoA hydratase [Desulfocicer vacuolatum DSM 3385]